MLGDIGTRTEIRDQTLRILIAYDTEDELTVELICGYPHKGRAE